MSWGTLGAVIVGGSVLAWSMMDSWWPPLRQSLEQSLEQSAASLQRQGRAAIQAPAAALPSAAPAQPQPPEASALRKCLDAQGRTTYTQQPCPSNTKEQTVGGAVTVLGQ